MEDVYIIAAQRTPIGSMGGQLAAIPAPQLGGSAIKGALQKGDFPKEAINEVYMGNVLSANAGQAPARQAALNAGISDAVPCTTVNKVCASGAKAVMLGAQGIMTGITDAVVAGGMENMSQVPYYVDQGRFGYKLGHGKLTDGILKDGLWDVYNDYHMGNAAENTAKNKGISRDEQDEYARTSYERANTATDQGWFKNEITAVEVPGKKESTTIEEDEECRKVKYEKIPNLPPVFDKNGTVTAANASGINDGAAALILASKEKAEELGVQPLARIKGIADAAQAPEWFTTTPSLAIPKAIENAGIQQSDVDYYEINEAFAVVSIANNRALELNPERVNVFGGAIALGHPIGCSGARIITTLLNVLEQKDGTIGVAGICNGGGGASALVLERL